MKRPYAALLLAALTTSAACFEGRMPSESATASDGVEDFVQERILFVGTQGDGRSDLYSVTVDGKSLINLTEQLLLLEEGTITPLSEAHPYPVPSADGLNALVVVSIADGTGNSELHLVEVNTRTRAAVELGILPSNTLRMFYDLAAERVFYETRNQDGSNRQLFELIDGEANNLTPEGYELSFEDYFPDGDRFLVRLSHDSQVYLAEMQLEDHSLQPFTQLSGTEALQAVLSPDGQQVAFEGWRAGEGCSDLFVQNTLDSEPELAADAENMPQPMGLSELVWNNLYGDPSTGEHQPRLSPEVENHSCLPVFSPAWAQDGSNRLAFLVTTNPEIRRNDVYVVDLSSEEPSPTSLSASLGNLVEDPGVTSPPRWAPSYNEVLFNFSTQRDNEEADLSLFVSEADGTSLALELTADYAGTPSMHHWNKNGDMVLFRSITDHGDGAGSASGATLVSASGGSPMAINFDSSLFVSYPMWMDDNTLLY